MRRTPLLVMEMLALLAVQASAVIMLDVGPGTSTVQAGWTAIDKWNDYAHVAGAGSYLGAVNLGGGVTAGFANGYNHTSYDRGDLTATPLNALGLNDLLRDYVAFSTADNPNYLLQIKGLTPGIYTVTAYAVDSLYLSQANSLSINGTKLLIGPGGNNPTLSLVCATVNVTVDATGRIDIGRGVGSGPSKLNAIMITAAPEPVSLLLLLAGAGLAVVRRR
jgi:hypothetical protein